MEKKTNFLNDVFNALPDDILKVILYTGSYTKEQLVCIINAKIIQRWYKKHKNSFEAIRKFDDPDEAYYNNYPYKKSYHIRLKILEYNNNMWSDYPNFCINKGHLPITYNGSNKKSNIIKWIIENINTRTLEVVGH